MAGDSGHHQPDRGEGNSCALSQLFFLDKLWCKSGDLHRLRKRRLHAG